MRVHRYRLLTLAATILILFTASPTRADPYEDALVHFLADNFNSTVDGINGVALSGNALAEKVVGALQASRLLFSAQQKKVFFRDDANQLYDALTGGAVTDAAPGDLSPVRLNNRVRGVIQGILGSLTLLSPDPAKRMEAAQAVFKSRDANALPALDQAIAKETNPRIKRAL